MSRAILAIIALVLVAYALRRPRFTDWYEPFAEPFGDA